MKGCFNNASWYNFFFFSGAYSLYLFSIVSHGEYLNTVKNKTFEFIITSCSFIDINIEFFSMYMIVIIYIVNNLCLNSLR